MEQGGQPDGHRGTAAPATAAAIDAQQLDDPQAGQGAGGRAAAPAPSHDAAASSASGTARDAAAASPPATQGRQRRAKRQRVLVHVHGGAPAAGPGQQAEDVEGVENEYERKVSRGLWQGM